MARFKRASEYLKEASPLDTGLGKYPVLQTLVYDLFCDGGKFSAADISKALGLSDPRGYIRDLREKGVNIRDEYRKGVNGGKYKVYWLEKEDQV